MGIAWFKKFNFGYFCKKFENLWKTCAVVLRKKRAPLAENATHWLAAGNHTCSSEKHAAFSPNRFSSFPPIKMNPENNHRLLKNQLSAKGSPVKDDNSSSRGDEQSAQTSDSPVTSKQVNSQNVDSLVIFSDSRYVHLLFDVSGNRRRLHWRNWWRFRWRRKSTSELELLFINDFYAGRSEKVLRHPNVPRSQKAAQIFRRLKKRSESHLLLAFLNSYHFFSDNYLRERALQRPATVRPGATSSTIAWCVPQHLSVWTVRNSKHSTRRIYHCSVLGSAHYARRVWERMWGDTQEPYSLRRPPERLLSLWRYR